MKKQCSNHPKYMYSGKESSPLGLGIAPDPLILGTIQQGRDKTDWIVALKNGIKVWSRITRMSEMTDKDTENDTAIKSKNDIKNDGKKDADAPVKKRQTATRKKTVKKDETTQGTDSIQDNTDNLATTEKKKEKQKDTEIKENETEEGDQNTVVPVKRRSTYNIYMKYKLKQLAKEDSTMKPKERIAHAVALWQSMDENVKQDIIEKAREALEKGEI